MGLELKNRLSLAIEAWQVFAHISVPDGLWDWLRHNHPLVYKEKLEVWGNFSDTWRAFLAGNCSEAELDLAVMSWFRHLQRSIKAFETAHGKRLSSKRPPWFCGACKYFESRFIDSQTEGIWGTCQLSESLLPETAGCPSFTEVEVRGVSRDQQKTRKEEKK